MDGRIFYVNKRQLSRIRTQDLPQLAQGICGYQLGILHSERCYKKQVAYIRLYASNYEMFILANDWVKLVPYFINGSFTPFIVAPQPKRTISACEGIDGWSGKDLTNISSWDQPFYGKVYATLQLIFTQSYPTSRL